MKTGKHNKTVSLLLTLTLLSITNSNAFAVGTTANDDLGDIAQTAENFALPDIVTAAEAEEYGFVSRDYDAEPNLNTFIFNNADGTNTMKVYAHPVKYEDKDGKIKDITLNLNQNRDGSFTTADNNIITTLPNELSEGITLTYENINLRMIPETGRENITAKYNERTRQVSYQADEQTSYVYGLTYSGFKEDIVVAEYTGQTEYRFTLYTDGLTLTDNEGTFFLTDKEGETAANLSDIIVYTADDRNNTFGSMTYRTVKENEQYDLTIHLDEEFLRSEATAYPIRIDPSIVVNSSANMTMSSIYSNSSTPTGLTSNVKVGKYTSSVTARALIGFPNLDLSDIHSSMNVSSAKIEMYEELHSTQSVRVEWYQFNGNWTGSSATWSGLDQDNDKDIYTHLGTTTISNSTGEGLNTPHRYSFDITLAAKRWVDVKDVPNDLGYDVFRPYEGIIFKSSTTVEHGNTVKYKQFASCYSASNKPSLTIIYIAGIRRNAFFSKFDPLEYYSAYTSTYIGGNIYSSDLIRYRANCYGYSFGYFYDGHTQVYLPENIGIQQTPGDFALSGKVNPDGSSVLSDYIDAIEHNMQCDAARFGYTITEYVVTPGSTTLPQYGQYGINSRMIALAVGNYPVSSNTFHFYQQHSDGTWSHKMNSNNISCTSIQDSTNESLILTNDNIYECTQRGKYFDGIIRYYIITKNSTKLPYKNSSNNSYTIINNDNTGDYFETSKQISVSSNYSHTHQIDFIMDDDVFYIPISTTRLYHIAVSLGVTDLNSIAFGLYNNDGVLIKWLSSSSTVEEDVTLTAGKQYYLKVYDPAIHKQNNAMSTLTSLYDTPGEYILTIS